MILTGFDRIVPARHILDERPQRRRTAPTQQPVAQHNRRALQQRRVVFARAALNGLHRFVAQPALGVVHHPLERQIVGRRHRQPEIGHRIADLQAFIEPRAADHPIGQADGQKPILERAHLMAGAHQNRHAIGRLRRHAARAALQRLDLIADPARLVLTVPVADQTQLFALGQLGPQGLAQPPLIARDHP